MTKQKVLEFIDWAFTDGTEAVIVISKKHGGDGGLAMVVIHGNKYTTVDDDNCTDWKELLVKHDLRQMIPLPKGLTPVQQVEWIKSQRTA